MNLARKLRIAPDCPQAESPLRPIVYVPQLRFLPGMPSNDDRPTPPAMAGRAA